MVFGETIFRMQYARRGCRGSSVKWKCTAFQAVRYAFKSDDWWNERNPFIRPKLNETYSSTRYMIETAATYEISYSIECSEHFFLLSRWRKTKLKSRNVIILFETFVPNLPQSDPLPFPLFVKSFFLNYEFHEPFKTAAQKKDCEIRERSRGKTRNWKRNGFFPRFLGWHLATEILSRKKRKIDLWARIRLMPGAA